MPHDASHEAPMEMQFSSPAHQAETALAGMWLFLATELLFFGGLFFIWLVYRHTHAVGFAAAAEHTSLLIGATNTIILLASSLAFTLGLLAARIGDYRALLRFSLVTAVLGLAFIGLKGLEWGQDFSEHLFPGPGFGITGADAGGAQLFYAFYFVATGLHAVHMLVGIALVLWIAWGAWHDRFGPAWHTPVEVVALYWSFVDLIWVVLFPLIYVSGRV